MVKYHSDSQRGNPIQPLYMGYSFMYHHTDRVAHTTAFVTPVMKHWLEREIAQWVFIKMHSTHFIYSEICRTYGPFR